ncbi:hypothetical protein A5320_18835 [Rheinheimera sp. SA_1]|uniref:hypothetical protein n=1 Tax=Rheinheimera sp. SA_1 TaxID=1827365 RepID=UPI0008009586|nr:hypothetical protein [Rheinheimera sp. SA_1]OBP13369.1 hypothetical protein A5320_18835 [Rheinheimera sp. SA_1]
MNSKEETVTVVARHGVDLDKLSERNGPMYVSCGSIGPTIAQAVKEGKGKANFSLMNLKIAMDNQSGVEMVFDNFEVLDSKSLKPLVLSLIAEHLNRSK